MKRPNDGWMLVLLALGLVTACPASDDASDETAAASESAAGSESAGSETAATGETGLGCVEAHTQYVELDAEGNCMSTPAPEIVCVATEGLDGCAPGTNECPGSGDLVWVKEIEPGKWEMLVLPYSCAQPQMGFEGCGDYTQPPCSCGCV